MLASQNHIENNEMCHLQDDIKELKKELKTEIKSISEHIDDVKHEVMEAKADLYRYISENNWKAIGILATFQTLTLCIFGVIQYFKNAL